MGTLAAVLVPLWKADEAAATLPIHRRGKIVGYYSSPVATRITTGIRPWTEQSLCAGMDPTLWFPEVETGKSNIGHSGKAICAACPVSRDCLSYAIIEREENGIWGGCGEKNLRALARIFKARTCDGLGWKHGCDCLWCEAVDDAVKQDTVFDANGEGATHGKRVTYARGCRCLACQIEAGVYSIEQRSTRAA